MKGYERVQLGCIYRSFGARTNKRTTTPTQPRCNAIDAARFSLYLQESKRQRERERGSKQTAREMRARYTSGSWPNRDSTLYRHLHRVFEEKKKKKVKNATLFASESKLVMTMTIEMMTRIIYSTCYYGSMRFVDFLIFSLPSLPQKLISLLSIN